MLATAVTGCCQAIVTYNIADFPFDKLGSFGIEATHPDDFLLLLFHKDSLLVTDAIRHLVCSKSHPPRTLEEELAALKRNRLTKFSAALETTLS